MIVESTAKPRAARTGFTLIELMLVVTLVVLFVGGAAISLRGPIARARFESELTRCRFFEASCRAQCRQSTHSFEIVFSPSDNAFEVVRPQGNSSLRKSIRLVRGCELSAVRLWGSGWTTNTETLIINGKGESPTYALRFFDSTYRTERFFIVTGISGQWIELDSEKQVDDWFQLIGTRWSDID